MTTKLDTKSGVLIGITKTKFNLQIFEQKYDDRYEGNKRLYHYEFTGPDNEKFYPVFYVERANKNSLAMVCNHKYSRKCNARLSVKMKFPTEEIPTGKSI